MPNETLSVYIELVTDCTLAAHRGHVESLVDRLIASVIADGIERARDNETLGDIPRNHIDRVLSAAFPETAAPVRDYGAGGVHLPCASPDLTTLYHRLMEDGVHADDCPAILLNDGTCNCGVGEPRNAV